MNMNMASIPNEDNIASWNKSNITMSNNNNATTSSDPVNKKMSTDATTKDSNSLDDRDMAMGSLRATGGVFRGRALGNAQNIADMGKFHV
jgi:hypothetical protein